ncbi:MAG: hypothetical protein J1F43_06495 [Muribaculaceae bacterium]|nr:hypothetical protein [Muribaculaceae bacterium]
MAESNQAAFINACPRCVRNHACRSCGRREPRGKLTATDWMKHLPSDEATPKLIEVIFKNTRVGFFENSEGLDLKIGDLIVVEGSPGYDIGRINMVGHLVKLQMKKAGFKDFNDLKKVLRPATDDDLDKFEEARSREHSTMIKARSIAEELGLAMKIGDVEFQGDGSKAIFYYIADERVDFRKLIRILAETFKVRIEMKQIGARQEAGRIGGIGPCGRPLCCSSWMNRFVSVGTGAARIQDLSMNPQKLAGQCGKLKCCLNFEIDSYAEASKELPPKDAVLESKDSLYFLFKADILQRELTYSTDKHIPSNLVTISAERAFEILDLNKRGVRPERISNEELIETPSEFGDIIGQDSLTRFDKKGNNKKRKKNKSGQNQFSGESNEAGQSQNDRKRQGKQFRNHANQKNGKFNRQENQ